MDEGRRVEEKSSFSMKVVTPHFSVPSLVSNTLGSSYHCVLILLFFFLSFLNTDMLTGNISFSLNTHFSPIPSVSTKEQE